jgi:hypothetical protein
MRIGIKIGCIEGAAFRQGFITKTQLDTVALAAPKKSGFGKYLFRLI